MGLQAHAEELAGLLRANIRDELKLDREAALMFSGGVDSATLAVVARKSCDLKLYVSGVEDSHDVRWGCRCADLLDLPYECITYKRREVIESLENVVRIHGMDNPRWVSTFVAFDLVLQKINEKLVLCGQGADELFAGYKKYRHMEPGDAEAGMRRDFEELKNDEFPLYQRMAGNYGRILLAPFLDPEIRRYSDNVPFKYKLDDENKRVLRAAAGFLGVPGSMAEKPKKAMQYGSGVSKVLKSHIKSSGCNLGEIMQSIKHKQKDYE